MAATAQAPQAPLTRDELDQGKCENPGCNETHPLSINARCHAGAPTFVWYVKETGVLLLLCAVCDRSVAQIQVAYAT